MQERVFCIDFGAAYTKVALRAAVQESARTVHLGPGVLDFCAPSLVVADWTGGRSRPDLTFGDAAINVKPGPKVAVYTNFKRDLFAPPTADKPAPHPLEALLQSNEFEALAAQYKVQPASLHALRLMVHAAQSMHGVPDALKHSGTRKQDEARTVAGHYFKWLFERVMKACEKLPHVALNYQKIPVRIAVPAFGNTAQLEQHPGCVRLREAMKNTGWTLDESRPFISEPEANAIGILTKASNLLTAKKKINLGGMFDKGPLITVVKGDKNHSTYRALVIDVGAYTTDFAALQVTTNGKFVESTDAGWFSCEQRSVPFGVRDLDDEVRAALPEDKRTALDGLSRQDFAEFQVRAYTEDTGFRLANRVVLGGAADRPAVEKCLETFAARLAIETTTFFQSLGSVSMQELILTGGGCNIPTVRDALLKATSPVPGTSFVKTHAAGLKKVKGGTPLDPLDPHFARGGSALGGASIYFEQFDS